MVWLIIPIVIILCILLSKVEDYSYFDFNEEAILIGKKKILKIKYSAINLIERTPFINYESDVSYVTYHFYYTDETGKEIKFVLRRASSFKVFEKWNEFKKKIVQINPAVVINENLI